MEGKSSLVEPHNFAELHNLAELHNHQQLFVDFPKEFVALQSDKKLSRKSHLGCFLFQEEGCLDHKLRLDRKESTQLGRKVEQSSCF